MANPYWSNTEGIEDADFNSIEAYALETAIQNSLKSLQQEQEQENISDMDQPTDLPKRFFTAEEIEEDDRRRERELYGPPTPPRHSQQVPAMNSSAESVTSMIVNTSGTNSIAHGRGTEENSQKDDTVDPAGETVSGIVGFGGTAANSGQISSGAVIAGMKSTGFGQASLRKSADMVSMISSPRLTSSQARSSSDSSAAIKQVVSEIVDVMVDYNNTAVHGNTPSYEVFFSPIYDGIASSVAPSTQDSGRAAWNWDTMVARRHADRVATIEAALNNPQADLEAVVQARRARGIIGRAPAGPAARVTGDQITPASRSRLVAGQAARDEELEGHRGESSVSPQPGSEPAQSPGQGTQPQ